MENLAFVFQELLTVGERLQSNRQQVTDAATFRAQIWGGVKLAHDEARKLGYNNDDVELATFAVVAFLDASILNLQSPVFADWPRQPLQEERYGHHIAGEIFFQNLQKLMGRSDSQELADLLEVYYLCLLLGFAGRYSLGGRGDLAAITNQTGERIQRIRQTGTELAPGWRLPGDGARGVSTDPWVFRLAIAAGVCAVLLIASFAGYYLSLNTGITTLQTTARAAK
jgi:type VI secretion system protein ImpK